MSFIRTKVDLKRHNFDNCENSWRNLETNINAIVVTSFTLSIFPLIANIIWYVLNIRRNRNASNGKL